MPVAGRLRGGRLGYLDGSGHEQAFVVSETKGVWGNAAQVPGTAALSNGQFGAVNSVSCGDPGDCAAGGSYTDSAGYTQAWVVSERHGVWGNALEVPGAGALNGGGNVPRGVGFVRGVRGLRGRRVLRRQLR